MSRTKLKVGRCVLAEKVSRPRADKAFSPMLARLREVEKVIRTRHGQFIPDPQDTDDRETCLDYVRAAAFSLAPQGMEDWCRRWAPWVRMVDLVPIEAQARRRRRMITADGAAGLLRVTFEERTRLGLMTIGACDMKRAARLKSAKGRKRERDRLRQEAVRRAVGRRDRKSYEAESLSQTRPWEAEGISRRTWERRRDAGLSRLVEKGTGDTLASTPHSPERKAVGEAGRHGVWGATPQRWCQEAEPHGSGDEIRGEAA